MDQRDREDRIEPEEREPTPHSVHTGHAGGEPRPVAEPIEDEATAEEVAQEGPEGKPTVPAMSAFGLMAVVGGSLLLLTLLAVAVGYFVDFAAGVIIFGLVLATVALNPAVRAALFRAHDRDVVQRRHDEEKHPRVINRAEWR